MGEGRQLARAASRAAMSDATSLESIEVIATGAQGPVDPAFRIRLDLPGQALEGFGVHLRLRPLFNAQQARVFRKHSLTRKIETLVRARRSLRHELLGPDADISTVVVQRQVDLSPSLSLERAATRGRRLVYDVDDAVWLTGRETMGHALGVLKASSRKVRWLAERAEHILAGNELLADALRPFNQAVTVVPSMVDPSSYPLRAHTAGEALTLGWVGSPTTAPFLGRIQAVLERFAAGFAQPVRLLVIGGTTPHPEGVEVVERAWSPQAERAALEEMDIGLMPLPDNRWTRGKCAYKALQYMASGIPPIADDVGISAGIVADAGWVAVDHASWLEGLHTLAVDVSLRASLGKTGRERVERDFSIQRWVPTLSRVLRGA